jgi:hypothetical protein
MEYKMYKNLKTKMLFLITLVVFITGCQTEEERIVAATKFVCENTMLLEIYSNSTLNFNNITEIQHNGKVKIKELLIGEHCPKALFESYKNIIPVNNQIRKYKNNEVFVYAEQEFYLDDVLDIIPTKKVSLRDLDLAVFSKIEVNLKNSDKIEMYYVTEERMNSALLFLKNEMILYEKNKIKG